MTWKQSDQRKDEQMQTLRIAEDQKFDAIAEEPHDFLLNPQQILLIENARKFLMLKNEEFVPNFNYSLIGMKFATFFAMGANKLSMVSSGENFIVVTNELTKETVKFINENYIKEVLQNVG